MLEVEDCAGAAACADNAVVFAEFDCSALRLSATAPRSAAKTSAAMTEVPRVNRGDELIAS